MWQVEIGMDLATSLAKLLKEVQKVRDFIPHSVKIYKEEDRTRKCPSSYVADPNE